MRKKEWPYVLLIALCLVVFFAYWIVNQISADTEAPKISVDTQQLEVSVQDDKSALLQGVTAVDNKDGDVTASLLVENIQLLDTDGTVAVTYAAFDRAGNVAKAQRQAQYTDYESPKFTLDAPLAFAQSSNFDVLSVIGAQDVIDGDIQHRIRATSLDTASISTPGNHKVQFRVTNSLGDTVEEVFPVEVYAAGTYEATLTLTDYLIRVPVGTNFRAEHYMDTFTVNHQTFSLKNVFPEEYSLSTSGRVDTDTPGVYSMGFTVTYTPKYEGNFQVGRKYTGYSKLIVVVEG